MVIKNKRGEGRETIIKRGDQKGGREGETNHKGLHCI